VGFCCLPLKEVLLGDLVVLWVREFAQLPVEQLAFELLVLYAEALVFVGEGE
jgi:hypothetical protein